jgi:hypothetical protein
VRQIPEPPSQTEFLDVHYGPPQARKTRKGWPALPLQERALGHDFPLDSYYSNCEHDSLELLRGSDFDVVVCALPLGTVQDVLIEKERGALSRVDGPWRSMFEQVRLTESQAIRMWFKVSLEQLGWRHEPPILSGTDWPHSTWEDNSQSVHVQDFPDDEKPAAIGTLFGPLATGQRDIRDAGHHAAQLAAAEACAKRFLEVSLPKLWPGLTNGQSQIDWSKFVDLERRRGEQRFGFQLVSANVGPNESYVLAWPGTLKYRARPDESGYQHLYLAGDWTRNGVEAGTVEGAVISGLKAAHAITGKGREIVGGNDFDYGTVFA